MTTKKSTMLDPSIKQLHRAFREDEHQICRFFHDQRIQVYSQNMSDFATLRYLEVVESEVETHVELLFDELQAGQLKGLSIDLPEDGEEALLDSTIELIQKYQNTLAGLNTLYLYVPVKLNLNALLESLPDLEYLYVYGDNLDVSMMRHVSLRHLISDDAEPIEGLETCSFPNLEYLEIDRANSLFFERLPELRLSKLQHLGILGSAAEDVDDLIATAHFPSSIRSLRLDGFPDTLDGDVLVKNAVSTQLTHMSFYDTEVSSSGIITKTNFPQLQHLGLAQEPESGGSMADSALEILANKELPPNIVSLDLQGTRLDDDELEQLIRLPVIKQLQYLNINFHEGTDEALLERFKQLDAAVYMAAAETGLDDDDDDDYE